MTIRVWFYHDKGNYSHIEEWDSLDAAIEFWHDCPFFLYAETA